MNLDRGARLISKRINQIKCVITESLTGVVTVISNSLFHNHMERFIVNNSVLKYNFITFIMFSDTIRRKWKSFIIFQDLDEYGQDFPQRINTINRYSKFKTSIKEINTCVLLLKHD